jgi:hypothetical protein
MGSGSVIARLVVDQSLYCFVQVVRHPVLQPGQANVQALKLRCQRRHLLTQVRHLGSALSLGT